MAEHKSVLEEFFCSYPLLTYEPGERFKRPNEPGQHVRYIKTGYIKIHHYGSSGKEISLYFAGPNLYKDLIFNYAPSFDKYYMTALTQVKLWCAPKKDCEQFLKDHPDSALVLIDKLYDAVSTMSLQTEWLKSGSSQIRISGFLIGLALYFSQKNAEDTYTLEFPITHQMIADYTGLTRETVSIQLLKLKNAGILEYSNGYIRIYALPKLVDIVSKIL